MEVALGCLVTLMVFAAACSVDVVVGLSRSLRWAGLVGALGCLVACWILGLRRSGKVARRNALGEIEKMVPQQGQLLRTAYEAQETNHEKGSLKEAMASGLVGRAEKITQEFDRPEKNLPWGALRRRGIFCILGLLVLAGACALFGDFFTASKRLWLPAADITFTKVNFKNLPSEILLENNLDVVVQTSGRFAEAPLLYVESEGKAVEELRMTASASEPGQWLAHLEKPANDLVLRAVAGDGTTEEVKVAVVTVPKVLELKATLSFPNYTQMKPVTQSSPNIRALEGTVVTVSITFDRPLKGGVMEISPGAQVPLQQEGNSVKFSGTLEEGKRTWKLSVQDHRGLQAQLGGQWIGERDAPPKVELLFPQEDASTTVLGEISLRAKASDDLGILETGLVLILNGKEMPLATTNYGGAAELPLSTIFEGVAEMEKEFLAVNSNVKIYAYARDRYPAAAGKERRGVSELRNVDIRQLKSWIKEASGPLPPANKEMPLKEPKELKELKELEALIKAQRKLANIVFQIKEENRATAANCFPPAEEELMLQEDVYDFRMSHSSAPTAQKDDDFLKNAINAMQAGAVAMQALDTKNGWQNYEAALTSLIQLRKEILKTLSKKPPPSPSKAKKEQSAEAKAEADLAKEAVRLSNEEKKLNADAAGTAENSAESGQLAARQAAVEVDASEFFDKVSNLPQASELLKKRVSKAEKHINTAAESLRGRHVAVARPELFAASKDLLTIATHLKGLDQAAAAETVKLAAEMAKADAGKLNKDTADSGKTDSSGKPGASPDADRKAADAAANDAAEKELAAKQAKAKAERAREAAEKAQQRPGAEPGEADALEKEADAAAKDAEAKEAAARVAQAKTEGGEGKAGADGLGKDEGKGSGDKTADSGAAAAGAGSPGEEAVAAANNAETIDEWLKKMAEAEDSGTTAEKASDLRNSEDPKKLAEELRKLAEAGKSKERNLATEGETTAKKQKELAAQLAKLAARLQVLHEQMIAGSLAKIANAQAHSQQLRAAAKPPSPTGKPSPAGSVSEGNKGQSTTSSPSGSPGGTNNDPAKQAKMLQDDLKEIGNKVTQDLSQKVLVPGVPGAEPTVNIAALDEIDAALETLLQDIIRQQLRGGKPDRIPNIFHGRVESYFRSLSEDTGLDSSAIPEGKAGGYDEQSVENTEAPGVPSSDIQRQPSE